MLNRSLSILLTAMLVACPYFCKGGGPCSSDEHAELHAHCGCSHSEDSHHSHDSHDEESSAPHDDSPSCPDQCGGQCICNGAVVEDAISLDLNVDAGWWVAAAIPQALLVNVPEDFGGPSWIAPPPDDGANFGRTLCCLHQSFLC